jgi:CubicO group peptidase (beta-lactamase class C family)
MQTGKLVEPASLDAMWKDHSGTGYGYGFGIMETPGGRVVGHGGGFPGLNSNLDVFTSNGYIIALMSNYDMGVEGLQEYIRRLVTQRLQIR